MSGPAPVASVEVGRKHGTAGSGPAVSDRAADPRPRPRSLRNGARPADHQPARPYRPALVCRGRARSPTRPGSSWCPITTSSACSVPRACRWPTSACPGRTAARPRPTGAGSGAASPSIITCSAARRRGSGSTTPSRRSSASRRGFRRRPPIVYYDRIADCLRRPEFRPRALFGRFNIEAISTTDSALDDLRWHRMIRDSGWDGRVVPAYRPDSVVDPEFEGFAGNLDAARRDHRLRHRDLGGLPRRPPPAPRVFQGVRRHQLRPRPPHRPHRGSAAGRGRGALRQGPLRARPPRRRPTPSAARC